MPRQHMVQKKGQQKCLGFFLQCCPNAYTELVFDTFQQFNENHNSMIVINLIKLQKKVQTHIILACKSSMIHSKLYTTNETLIFFIQLYIHKFEHYSKLPIILSIPIILTLQPHDSTFTVTRCSLQSENW